MWLEDVINETTQSMFRSALVVKTRRFIHCCNQNVLAISGHIRRVSLKKVVKNLLTRVRRKTHTLPTTHVPPMIHSTSPLGWVVQYPEPHNSRMSEESETSRRAIARQRFRGAVRSIIMMQQTQAERSQTENSQTEQTFLRPALPSRSPSFDRNSTNGMSPTRFSSFGLPTLRGPRTPNLIPKLRTLEPMQDLSVHSALVRHLQFSPSGKYLATSRCVMAAFFVRLSQLIRSVKLGSVFRHLSCRGRHTVLRF